MMFNITDVSVNFSSNYSGFGYNVICIFLPIILVLFIVYVMFKSRCPSLDLTFQEKCLQGKDQTSTKTESRCCKESKTTLKISVFKVLSYAFMLKMHEQKSHINQICNYRILFKRAFTTLTKLLDGPTLHNERDQLHYQIYFCSYRLFFFFQFSLCMFLCCCQKFCRTSKDLLTKKVSLFLSEPQKEKKNHNIITS